MDEDEERQVMEEIFECAQGTGGDRRLLELRALLQYPQHITVIAAFCRQQDAAAEAAALTVQKLRRELGF